MRVVLAETDNPKAVMGSKAVGEPPFVYGLGAFFALRDALRAAGAKLPPGDVVAPLTPEQALLALCGESGQ